VVLAALRIFLAVRDRHGEASGALRCQKAISTAGRKLLDGGVRALQRCRDGINRGTLPGLDPADCPTSPATTDALAATRRVARAMLARACTDADTQELTACADTVDGLVAPAADAGCLLSTHDGASTDVVDAGYGRVLLSGENAERTCQEAIGRGLAKYVAGIAKPLRVCRGLIDKGKFAFPPAECAEEPSTEGRLQRAGLALRTVVAASCTDTTVASITTCAATVDGLINAAGDAGCLVTAAQDAVAAVLTAEHGA